MSNSTFTFDPVLCRKLLAEDFLDQKIEKGPKLFAARALAQCIVKKLEPESSDELEGVAVRDFLASNQLCKNVDLKLTREQKVMLRSWIRSDFYDFPDNWESIFSDDFLRVGPGASVGSSGHNSAYEKLAENQDVVSNVPLLVSFLKAEAQQPNLSGIRSLRNASGKGHARLAYSTLSTVPKNSSTDRTICVEPAINMKGQLLIGDRINGVLKLYGYDPAVQQERNRRMARDGSIAGHLATIDLKAASDRISLKLVCNLFVGTTLLGAMFDCRSPKTEYKRKTIPMYMFSSMGNGFTFPLETYIFTLALRLALVEGGLLGVLEKPDFSSHQYGVFGDDIICPTSIYGRLCDILDSFGFTVNGSKSFASGPFRESCGGDFYHGYDVRAVYVKRCKTIQERYSAVNRLLRWSAKHGISLKRVVAYILPERWIYDCIPPDLGDDAGLKVPGSGSSYYYSYAPRVKFSKLAVGVNRNAVLLLASYKMLDSRGIVYRSDDVVYKRTKCFTPEWQYAAGVNIDMQYERLNHRFQTQYATGLTQIAPARDLLNGVAYRDWSDAVLEHIPCSEMVRVRGFAQYSVPMQSIDTPC